MAGIACITDSVVRPESLVLRLRGAISADNAPLVEEDIERLRAEHPDLKPTIDARDLEYISSAGLRVVMRLLKRLGSLTLVNANTDVYDVFEMTGLTELMDVRRAPREIDVEGLEVIGRGGQGTVYRLDADKVVKLYTPNYSMDDIDRERRYARAALVAGIPTAIPFDTVCCGDRLGVVFERAGEKTLAHAFADDPDAFGELIGRYVDFVREFHACELPAGIFDGIADIYRQRIENLRQYCTPEEIELLSSLVDEIPASTTPIHGDLHPGNIMVAGDELLLIDMPEVTQGPSKIDEVNLFRDIVSAPKNSPADIERSMDVPADLITRIGGAFFSAYTGITDPERLGQYFQGLGLLYAFSVVLTMGMGGEAVAGHVGPVLDKLLRGVVVPNEQALRHMIKTMS